MINEVAVEYWKKYELSVALITSLTEGPTHFVDAAAWNARLKTLGVTDARLVRITTEGALLGSLIAQGVSTDLVVLSDGAGQFNILVHAACWVHAERPLARMIPYNEEHRLAIERVRQEIWELYQDLKAYRQQPQPEQIPVLTARFEALCAADQLSQYQYRAEGDVQAPGRLAPGAGPAGGAVAQQRLGVGHPGLREKAENQRQHAE